MNNTKLVATIGLLFCLIIQHQHALSQDQEKDVVVDPAQKKIALDLGLVRQGDLVNENGDIVKIDILHGKLYRLGEEQLESILKLKHLESLTLAGCRINDSDIEKLTSLSKLKSLTISRNGITSIGLKALAKFEHLESLDISDSNFSDNDSLSTLSAKLKKLNLSGTNLTSDCLKHLARLTNLESLRLPDVCAVSDLAQLEGLKKLKELRFKEGYPKEGRADKPNLIHVFQLLVDSHGNSVDEVAKILGQWSGYSDDGFIEHLSLGESYRSYRSYSSNSSLIVDDRIVPYLNRLKHLKSLEFIGTQVTDKGLEAMQFPPTLTKLVLRNNFSGHVLKHVAKFDSIDELKVPHRSDNDSLKHLAGMPQLKSLDFTGCPIGQNGLVHLNGLKNLIHLNLSDTRVRNPATAMLEMFPGLETLILENCKVSDEALGAVGKFSNLVELNLDGTKVSDAGIQKLAGLKNLKKLSTNETTVTPRGRVNLFKAIGIGAKEILELEGVRYRPREAGVEAKFVYQRPHSFYDVHMELLPEIENLTHIRMYRIAVTDKGIEHLTKIPGLNTLYVYRCQGLGDDSLLAISKIKSLQYLTLHEMEKASDVGVAALAKLTNLKSLHLRSFNISDQTIENLKAALPNCDVNVR